MHPTLEEVCEKALALPCSPALLPRLQDVLSRPDATVEEMEAVIRTDPVLTSATIRLANSAYFAGAHAPVESVGEALMRLGLTEVFRLAALALAGRWMTLEVDGYRWEPGDFFRVSLVTAIAAEILADQTEALDPRHAYTAGLMAEIGKLAVAYSCGGAFPEIRCRQEEMQEPWIEAERAILGYDHGTVGAALLRQWRFPERYVAVAEHVAPGPDVPSEHLALVAHVHAAKYVASALGTGQGEDGFLFAVNTELLSNHGFTAEALDAVFFPVLERSEKILRDKFAVGRITL